MAASAKEVKEWTIITPIGKIYCDHEFEAYKYWKIYRYKVLKTIENEHLRAYNNNEHL